MKKTVIVSVSVLAMSMLAATAFADVAKGGKVDGKKEFQEHCASCHPKGGNIVNPKKTLGKKALAADGIKTSKDIVAKMRKPGPGMTAFDAKSVSDKEAMAIADYVLATFK